MDHELINGIHQCTVQSQRCNLQMGVITDCTRRDERLGYGGDVWSMAREALYNVSMPRGLSKWIREAALRRASH